MPERRPSFAEVAKVVEAGGGLRETPGLSSPTETEGVMQALLRPQIQARVSQCVSNWVPLLREGKAEAANIKKKAMTGRGSVCVVGGRA